MKIEGNHSLLKSVFSNLIVNANAYSQGSCITITQLSESFIEFADNGVGIPEEHLPHIFERFYRIDKGRSRDKGGTGLGLAIVKHALAFHGFAVTAHNRPVSGLSFLIDLQPDAQ